MARPRVDVDAFAVIAEPRRRELVKVLTPEPRCVSDIVKALGWPQAQVSKHLAVLREAGVARVSPEGRRRLYSLNAEAMKPVHEWIRQFERYWTKQLDRIGQRAEAIAKERSAVGRVPQSLNEKQEPSA